MPHPPVEVVRPVFTKKKFNVYLDEQIVKEAKELGLNISKICENALITYVAALKKAGVTGSSAET